MEGTSWITGANRAGQHVFGLVAGRDFTWDATIESVLVRDGDPAPDRFRPLTTRRGIEMGHIFMLGTKYADALGLQVLDENGKLSTVTMGSYGFGVTRALAALVEANHDDKGIIWPASVAPADIHLVATGKGDEVYQGSQELVRGRRSGPERDLRRPAQSFSPCEVRRRRLLGVPTIVVVGRSLAEGNVEVKDRRSRGGRADSRRRGGRAPEGARRHAGLRRTRATRSRAAQSAPHRVPHHPPHSVCRNLGNSRLESAIS